MRRSCSSLSKLSVLDISGVVQGSALPKSTVPGFIGGKVNESVQLFQISLLSGNW